MSGNSWSVGQARKPLPKAFPVNNCILLEMTSFVVCTTSYVSQRNCNHRENEKSDWKLERLDMRWSHYTTLLLPFKSVQKAWDDAARLHRVVFRLNIVIVYIMSVTYRVMNDIGNLEPTWPINQLSSHRLRNANKKWFYGTQCYQAPGFSRGGLGLMRQTQQAVMLVTLLI